MVISCCILQKLLKNFAAHNTLVLENHSSCNNEQNEFLVENGLKILKRHCL